MNKVLLLLAAVLCLASCKKDDDPIKGNMSPIYINGRNSTLKAAQKLNVHEILEKGHLVLYGDIDEYGGFGKPFGYEQGEIDLTNDRLIMEARNIIADGQLSEIGGIFLKARNYTLCTNSDFGDGSTDTLGYIPNSVIRSAQKDILDLWREGDIPAIYERFNESFYFIPCTAEEFKQIKEPIDWEHEYDEIRAIHGDTHNIKW